MVIWRKEVFDKIYDKLMHGLKAILDNYHKEQMDFGIREKNAMKG
jgi:hypothetical protein